LGGKRASKEIEGKIFRWTRIVALRAPFGIGDQESSRVVMPFAYQLSAKQFVALRVGGAFELRKDLKVRLLDGNGPAGSRAVLQQEEIPKPGTGGSIEGAFSVGRPEVHGASHGLLGPVVEVVAEGGTDLGLGFDGYHQLTVLHNQKVPFLRRPEETREFQRFSKKISFVFMPLARRTSVKRFMNPSI
jgi:hypothetical protein